MYILFYYNIFKGLRIKLNKKYNYDSVLISTANKCLCSGIK